VNDKRDILDEMKNKKRSWLGHVLHHDGVLRDILKERIKSKSPRGRKMLNIMSHCNGKRIVWKDQMGDCKYGKWISISECSQKPDGYSKIPRKRRRSAM